MRQDWAAVAATIDEHMTRLGLNQTQLAERSNVALSIVRELRHNTVHRRRSGRTLEAISVALGLPPRHLHTISIGKPPPSHPRPSQPNTANLPRELILIKNRLNELATQMTTIDAKLTTIIDFADPPHHEDQAQPGVPDLQVHPVAFRFSERQGSAG